jgi:hypothetical protein
MRRLLYSVLTDSARWFRQVIRRDAAFAQAP